MTKHPTTTVYAHYQAYLLRLWQESPQAPWRASLQGAVTGERHGFTSLESLFASLKARTEQGRGQDEEKDNLLTDD